MIISSTKNSKNQKYADDCLVQCAIKYYNRFLDFLLLVILILSHNIHHDGMIWYTVLYSEECTKQINTISIA